MNKVLSLQKVSVAKNTELKAGSSLSFSCDSISNLSIAVC
ncbi:class III lanthipeptide [Staphylococcus pseudintermedius]|nr:class III lanthipeptide [Staphylococcus pseudintermedius]